MWADAAKIAAAIDFSKGNVRAAIVRYGGNNKNMGTTAAILALNQSTTGSALTVTLVAMIHLDEA